MVPARERTRSARRSCRGGAASGSSRARQLTAEISIMTPLVRLTLFVWALVIASAAAARAQVEIYASDDVSIKLGILGQFQADTLEDPPTDASSDNLFIRRVRLMFGGQV